MYNKFIAERRDPKNLYTAVRNEKGKWSFLSYTMWVRSDKICNNIENLDIVLTCLTYSASLLNNRLVSVSGFGLYSKTDIFKGDFICEYVGDKISFSEADERAKDYYERRSFMLYSYRYKFV